MIPVCRLSSSFALGLLSSAESQYNDGKGIKYIVALKPLLPPQKPGEKRRKNAKADPINQTIFQHEDNALAQLLEAAIEAVGYDQILRFKVVADQLRAENFTVTWTIPRTEFQKMQLKSTDHYDDMITAALAKAAPTVKLELKQFEVCTLRVDPIIGAG